MTNSRAPARPGARQHPGQVRGHLARGLGRHPVEHDGERGAALLRRPQQVPRDGVGVAGRRRDENPEVRRRQQLTGELAVGLDHRVDVGGVEQREPGGQVVADDQLHACPAPPAAAGDPGQARQHPVTGERGHVGRRADQHRRPGGGPQHAGGGDRGADEAVDQRGLARTGRAADDGEQRGVEVAQPGEQVVVDLVDDRAGGAAGVVPVGVASPSGAARRAGPAAPPRASGSRGGGAVTPCYLPRPDPAYAPRSSRAGPAARRRPSWPAPRGAPGRPGGGRGPGRFSWMLTKRIDMTQWAPRAWLRTTSAWS